MEILNLLLEFILHIDKHLAVLVQEHGAWVYLVLFLIVFVETGVVIMPFLPGDSLLFVVGALAGVGLLDLPLVMTVLFVAAVLGDQTNFAIGRYVGPKVFAWESSRWFNKRAFDQAHGFYERYGGITIILARFMPFIRTFAPFVAGVADMSRSRFTLYNVVGGAVWVLSLCVAGYFLGSLPWVKQNLEKIIWGMILVPGLLVLWGAWRGRSASKAVS